jgi:hypothetical protein
MSKQRPDPQLPDEDELPEYLRNYKGTGAGMSYQPSDTAFWLDNDFTPWGIIDAIWHIDEHGDKAPLLKLLRGSGEQGDYYLADLLERYDLQRPRNRQRTPAYDLTRRERIIALACNSIRNRPDGVSVAAAIAEEVQLCKQNFGVTISTDALEAAYHGKRGGSRLGKRGTRYKKKPGRKAPA